MTLPDEINISEIATIQRKFFDLANSPTQGGVRDCLVNIRKLIGAEGSFAFYFHRGSPVIISDNIGEQVSDYIFAQWTGFDRDGYFLFADKELETINRMRRSLGSGVHHERKIGSRDVIEQTDYFNKAFKPAGMHHVIGMSARLPIGEAVFAFGFSGSNAPGFNNSQTEHLLELILPVFEHTFNLLDVDSPSVRDMAEKIESLPCPAALVDEAGQVIFANEDYQERSEDVPSKSHIHKVAGPVLDDCRPSELVLILSQSRQAFDLSATAKQAGLSPRQVEIARLLAQGAMNGEIAERFDISIHTVRSHVEKVMDCLGVTSRAAVLPALMHRASIVIH